MSEEKFQVLIKFLYSTLSKNEGVILGKESKIQEILGFFMGKNTPDRQKFIIENLRVEGDIEI